MKIFGKIVFANYLRTKCDESLPLKDCDKNKQQPDRKRGRRATIEMPSLTVGLLLN